MKETEQTLLDQIKNDVARQTGYGEWRLKMYENGDEMMERIWLDVCERFATAKAQASCEELNTVLKRLGKDLMLVVCDDGSFDLINPSKFPSI